MQDEDLLLDRIRTHVYLNDAHLLEWFEDFDKLRSGRVSKDQFRRCFEFVHFSLKDNEFEYLCQLYQDNGDVNYRKFCHDVSIIFTNPDLEKNPKGTLADSKAIVNKTTNRLTIDIPPEVDALFAKLTHQCQTLGIHVRESYMDFDTHNCGRVTRPQFLRNLPFQNLTQKEKDILIQRYMDPQLGDVNYKRLHLDLIAYTGFKEHGEVLPDLELPHHKQSIKLHPLPSDPSTVIERFATFVHKQRVRVIDFFISHDPLNSGRVTPTTFQNVLTLFGFQFSAEELEDLSRRYLVTIDYTDYTNYRSFCADVTKAEKSMAGPTNSAKTTDRRAVQVLNKVGQYVAKNRINVLPPFQDFDKCKRGYVTELQFHRVLALMTIPVSPEDVGVLIAVYGNPDGVDYFKFVEDIDPSHSQQRRSFRPIGIDKKSIEETFGKTPAGDAFVTSDEADQLIYESKKGLLPKTQERHDIAPLLGDIQRWCYVHSVHLHDFMKDFDRFNCGEITKPQMRSAILMAGYRLTDDEFDLVSKTYQSPKHDDKVQWRRFANDVLEFVAPPDLEHAPLKQPDVPSRVMARTLKAPSADDTIPADVRRILENVNRYARARRLSLIEEFEDKDRYNHKQVSATGFAQVLQLIGVHLSMNEISRLSTFYLDPETNFVQYPKFVEDVESIGGIKQRLLTDIAVKELPPYALEMSEMVATKQPLTAEELTWRATLPRIQSYVMKRRIRLTQFFENFDRLRHGTVTQQKWNTVVGETNLPLVEDEIQFIGKLFAVETKPDLFNYRLFVQQVDAIFGPRELHRTPKADANCRAAYIPDPSMRTQDMTEAEIREVREIIARMHKYVTTRRMEIRQQFEDYDKSPHRNYITMPQFRQCIGRLGLTSDEHELKLLCKRYKCTDLNEMNYHAFCSDIGGYLDYSEQMEEINFQNTLHY